MKLTPHEQKILKIVNDHPEIINDPVKRAEIAAKNGVTEKTLRNRIADLKKYGVMNKKNTNKNIEQGDIHSIALLVELILRNKWFIIKGVFITTVFSIVISLLLPKYYSASAIILPPREEAGLSLGSIMSQLPLSNFGFGDAGTLSSMYLAVLQSRSVAEEVVHKFNLIHKYESENLEKAVKQLKEYTYSGINDDGTIFIKVFDKDQELVHEIANYYLVVLDKMINLFSTDRASNNRKFIESQIIKTENELQLAEEELRSFSENYGVVALEVQIEEGIKAIAFLKQQIMETEIQLNVLSYKLNDEHPEIERLKKTLNTLNTNYSNMLSADSVSVGYDIFHTLSDLPILGLQYVRLKREVEIQTTLLKFLIPEYEQAKIQEAKDTPTIQILDQAVRPEEKSKPKRSLIVILTFAISSISFIYYLVIKDKYFSST